ncbi:hypothetical protein HOY82DRAFT_391564 [Tuber indicum]|nr:hypothetical protein HOY82DRAFT_391564 [Tuber indicum]
MPCEVAWSIVPSVLPSSLASLFPSEKIHVPPRKLKDKIEASPIHSRTLFAAAALPSSFFFFRLSQGYGLASHPRLTAPFLSSLSYHISLYLSTAIHLPSSASFNRSGVGHKRVEEIGIRQPRSSNQRVKRY